MHSLMFLRSTMNIAKIIELKKYGFKVPHSLDLVYKKLKCYSNDVHSYFYPLSSSLLDVRIPIFACHFCPSPGYEDLLALANEDGRIVIKNTSNSNSNSSNEYSSIQGHNNAIFDLKWANTERRLISASGDHAAVLWEVREDSLVSVLRFHGHSRSVKTISWKPEDNNIFATGARDGIINLWDVRFERGSVLKKPENTISLCHFPSGAEKFRKPMGNRADSITGLVFQDENTLISCSAGDGIIKVWDLRKSFGTFKSKWKPRPKHVLPHSGKTSRNGFTCLSLSPCRLRLYANCIDHTIYCYNIGTYNKEPIACYKGHMASSFYLRNTVSPDGRYIACGSSDEKAYIWSVNKPDTPLVALDGHNAEVTCVDWCTKGELKMGTCSDDGTYRIWRLNPEEKTDQTLRGSAVECLTCKDTENTEDKRKKRSFKYCTPSGIEEERDAKTNKRTLSGCEFGSASQPQSIPRKGNIENTTLTKGDMNLTCDLPNWVVDGVSPHLHKCPRREERGENIDWLTKLSRGCSGMKQQTPPRRRSSRDTGPSTPTLLKFFRVAAGRSLSPSCQPPLEQSPSSSNQASSTSH